TQSRQHPTPPPAAHMPEEDAELGGRRPRHHVRQRQAFDEALLGHPLALFLELGLHNAHDRGSAVSRGTQLEETRGNLPPMPCKCFTMPAEHLYLLVSQGSTRVLRSASVSAHA